MKKKAPKKVESKRVGMYVEVPRELRDALHELRIPIAGTARQAFVDAVQAAAGRKALGEKKMIALVGVERDPVRRARYPDSYADDDFGDDADDDFAV